MNLGKVVFRKPSKSVQGRLTQLIEAWVYENHSKCASKRRSQAIAADLLNLIETQLSQFKGKINAYPGWCNMKHAPVSGGHSGALVSIDDGLKWELFMSRTCDWILLHNTNIVAYGNSPNRK